MLPPSLLQAQATWKQILHQIMLDAIAAFFQSIEDEEYRQCYELAQVGDTRWLIRLPMLPPEAMAQLQHIPDEEKYIVDGRIEAATDGLGWLIAFPVAVEFWSNFVRFAEAFLLEKGFDDCLFDFTVMSGKSQQSDGYTCLAMKYFGRRKNNGDPGNSLP